MYIHKHTYTLLYWSIYIYTHTQTHTHTHTGEVVVCKPESKPLRISLILIGFPHPYSLEPHQTKKPSKLLQIHILTYTQIHVYIYSYTHRYVNYSDIQVLMMVTRAETLTLHHNKLTYLDYVFLLPSHIDMYKYMHTYKQTNIYMHIATNIFINMYIHTHTYIYIYIYI